MIINLAQLTRVPIPIESWIYADLIESMRYHLSSFGYKVFVSENKVINGALNIIFGCGSHIQVHPSQIRTILEDKDCYLFNVEQLASGIS